MTTTPTRQSLETALARLLQADGMASQTHEVTVAVTQYNSPLLFAVIVAPRLRDALSEALANVTGRRWASHWEVWILNESDAKMLLTHQGS